MSKIIILILTLIALLITTGCQNSFDSCIEMCGKNKCISATIDECVSGGSCSSCKNKEIVKEQCFNSCSNN